MKNAALVALSILFALLLVEAGDRAWLYKRQPERFAQSMKDDSNASFNFMDKAMNSFNAEYGFDYKPNATFIEGYVTKGVLTGCTVWHTNSYGSWGREEENYDSADLKIVVVGSSFTARAINGVTWTDVLQDMLSEKLNKRVSIRNFGRDGTGILSNLDTAAGEIKRSRPDLIIIPYITDALRWDRVWRREEVVDGRDRLFTSPSPEFDLSRSVDRVIIAPNEPINEQWCRKQPAPDKNDPIMRELLTRNRIAVAQANARADLFALNTSFVFNALVHHDPYYHYDSKARTALPAHTLRDFRDDPRAAKDFQELKDSGIPVVIFHMATLTELKKGVEFIFANPVQDSALAKTLDEALGTVTWQTRNLAGQIETLDGFAITAGDDHPSLYGMRVYAQAVINGLEKAGLTGRGPLRLASNATAIPMTPIAPFIVGTPITSQTTIAIKATDGRVVRLLSDPAQLGGAADGYSIGKDGATVTGWAIAEEDGGPAQYVVAIADGKLVAWTEPNGARDDIAAGRGPAYRNCAFGLMVPNIDQSGLKSLRVYAVSKEGVGREVSYNSSLR